jgi:hypothetical protein
MSYKHHHHLRREVAIQAARLLADHTCDNYQDARNKAAARMGVKNKRLLPDNQEIHQALVEHQQIFNLPQQRSSVEALRQSAMEAMQAFAPFYPRLVGPILDGSADGQSPIRLHIFCENPEELALYLLERNIPWQERETIIELGGKRTERRPVFRFHAGPNRIELIVLTPREQRNPPMDPITGRPNKGASISMLKELIESDQR